MRELSLWDNSSSLEKELKSEKEQRQALQRELQCEKDTSSLLRAELQQVEGLKKVRWPVLGGKGLLASPESPAEEPASTPRPSSGGSGSGGAIPTPGASEQTRDSAMSAVKRVLGGWSGKQ